MTVTGLDPTLERVLDLGGVFTFALSGASLAAHKRFDIVGIAVLAMAAALGGGITRDVLIGEVPPAALRDQAYLLVPLVAVALVFIGHQTVERLRRPVLVFDAAGLALFCVVGAAKALDHGMGALAAVVLGVTTAVFGGVIRDTLAREVPAVFIPETALYAIPSALGAAGVAILWPRDALNAWSATAIVLTVFAVRLLSLRFNWQAPRARG